MLYSNDDVRQLFGANLKLAKEHLTLIPVYCGKEPKFTGLSGWIFEQTIQHCIRKELEARQIEQVISEQVELGHRSRADLSIGRIAIELKVLGLFSRGDFERYGRCKRLAEERGFQAYLYLTLGETYGPYREGLTEVLGEANTYFLDRPGDWARFITRLIGVLKGPAEVS